ncbi:hypothetical protein [Bacillus marasmi]|uniref:hypothetical protein n=1 Tax=Bacillus marasmi TaxID=1926279 RepID=UPI0011CA23CC|nr:hypothetical protein [Bacillus marasmi]
MEDVIELDSFLSDFDSYDEFMKYTEWWISENKDEFTPHELAALQWLIEVSNVIPGVCISTAETILYVIYHHRHGYIEKSTFNSMIKTAVKLGIISVYETHRLNEPNAFKLYGFNNIIELNHRTRGRFSRFPKNSHLEGNPVHLLTFNK